MGVIRIKPLSKSRRLIYNPRLGSWFSLTILMKGISTFSCDLSPKLHRLKLKSAHISPKSYNYTLIQFQLQTSLKFYVSQPSRIFWREGNKISNLDLHCWNTLMFLYNKYVSLDSWVLLPMEPKVFLPKSPNFKCALT